MPWELDRINQMLKCLTGVVGLVVSFDRGRSCVLYEIEISPTMAAYTDAWTLRLNTGCFCDRIYLTPRPETLNP